MTGSSTPVARHWWIATSCCCLLLAACGRDAPEKSVDGKAKGAAAAAPRAASFTDNMVAAVSAGKSATVVGVYFTLGAAPTVGTALPIDIAILPHLDFSSLRARFDSPGAGLTLVSGDNLAPFADLKAEKAIEYKLVFMPQKPGVFMVTANVETVGSEGTVSRIFSIPVIVAPAGGSEPAPETPPATAPASPPPKG